MAKLLEGGLAKIAGNALKGLFLDATLTREVSGTPDPTTPWVPGPPTTATYPCKAIEEEWGASYLADGLVLSGDRRILVLASTLRTEPAPGDRITIRGATFTIVPAGSGQPPVSTDPAKAAWVLRGKA